MLSIVKCIRYNNVLTPITMLLEEYKKRYGDTHLKRHSIYRELVYLTFMSLGRDNIDHGKFTLPLLTLWRGSCFNKFCDKHYWNWESDRHVDKPFCGWNKVMHSLTTNQKQSNLCVHVGNISAVNFSKTMFVSVFSESAVEKKNVVIVISCFVHMLVSHKWFVDFFEWVGKKSISTCEHEIFKISCLEVSLLTLLRLL